MILRSLPPCRHWSGAVVALLICLVGCGHDRPAGKTAAATLKDAEGKVARDGQGKLRFASEANQFTVVLTEEAYQRLNIAAGLAKVERQAKPLRQLLGGEAMVPPGRIVRVAAPLPGVILAADASAKIASVTAFPRPGQRVTAGTAVLRFTPTLSPDGKVNLLTAATEARQQVKAAKIQQQLAGTALERTEELAREKSASQRLVDEATAARDLADQAVQTAVARQELLDKLVVESASGHETTIPVNAPVAGVLQRLLVAAGESVAAGAELFEVVQVDPLWVRVPVFAGAIGELDLAVNAEVHPLAAQLGKKATGAHPTDVQPIRDAPPVADPLAASVDIYYRLPNTGGEFRPGEKVNVSIVARGTAESLVVPWSAVVFDAHGGAWVYEKTGARSFHRRRVEVRHVSGHQALLDTGPTAGSEVATGGVVELLGTELGFGTQATKQSQPEIDDD